MKAQKLKISFFKQWLCSLLMIAPLQLIFSHGTVTYPPSRVWVCFNELVEFNNNVESAACAAAIMETSAQQFYDWSGVLQGEAGGRHMELLPDGNLASAGRPEKFGGIDLVRDDWLATSVTPGPFTMTWTNVAPHQTLYYRVYITKEDWTPDQPLTWDNIELLIETEPRPAAAIDNIDFVLPPRTGKHVLFSIWQRSLTPEAFYSTSDIDFGNSSEPTAPVASFTSDNGDCGGPEVMFDASGSFDANGDALTYTWDFGDGNTAEGVEVTHVFADGIENSDVTLTVSDGTFSSGATETIDDLIEDPDCSGIVEVEGGSLTGGPFTFTIADGNADNATSITLSGAEGDNSIWLIENESGSILAIVDTPESFDFDTTEQGRYFIYHLSYNGDLQNLEVGNNTMDLEGEYDFSNSIDVTTTNEENPGIVYQDVVYDESIDGDLSLDNNNPTLVAFESGNNRVISTQMLDGDQANFFTFQVPEGYELSQLVVDSYEGSDDIGFIGIDEGTIISGQPTSNAPSTLIGGLSYGTANIGSNILSEMGDLNNPAAGFVDGFGFTPPLSSGQYTVWLNQTGINSTSVLNFIVTETENIEEPPIDGCEGIEIWSADTTYSEAGMQVVYNDNIYENKWYTSNQNPESFSVQSWDVWTLIGACDETVIIDDGEENETDCDIQLWNADEVYSEAGTQVVYNGVIYENQWYSRNENPESFTGNPWSLWITVGTCDTAAKSIASNFKVSAYPNPTIDVVTIEVTTFSGAITGKDIVISNLYGQTLDRVSIAEGEVSIPITLNAYPSGVYLILVYEGTQIISSHKIVKN